MGLEKALKNASCQKLYQNKFYRFFSSGALGQSGAELRTLSRVIL